MDKIRVFISYSHKDEVFKDELEAHLSSLVRTGLVSVWNDSVIEPGKNLDNEINVNIRTADVILLLVSPDFINSDYCYKTELEIALQQNEVGQSLVIPVILRPVVWENTPIGRLRALPKDGEAVSLWSNRDEAWKNVIEGITQSSKSFSIKRQKKRAATGTTCGM